MTGSNGKYQHEFSRNVDEWDAMNSLCEPYAWWTNLPETGLHTSNEERNYWCDIDSDEEAEIVTYGPKRPNGAAGRSRTT